MKTSKNFFELRVEGLLTPLENFIYKQTTAGILLFIAAFISILLANSPWKDVIIIIAEIQIGLVFHNFNIVLSFYEWISSGLMALFFFLIGLEMKREILAGNLRDIRQILPILMAAAGGMVLPAMIYWIFNGGSNAAHGWAIPMATDTAFAIAALALSAKRASPGMAVFLAALAIFDDIGAMIVVACFYSDNLNYSYLIQAFLPLSGLIILNVIGMRNGWFYAAFGMLLWWYINKSGVHPTAAGLILALTIPARTQLGQSGFTEKMKLALSVFEQKLDFGIKILESPGQHSLAMDLEHTVKSAVTPLQRWHSIFLNPVGIIVLPLFALFSAGINLSSESLYTALFSPVTLGITAGLVIGKPLGIFLLTLTAIKLNLGQLPEGMSMHEVIMAGLFSGIGFTMSLFLTTLSFQHNAEFIEPAKLGIILGSLISAFAACSWAFFVRDNIHPVTVPV